MAQAVLLLPSKANFRWPTNRLLPDLSSKLGSSGDSTCSKSVVPLAILNSCFLSGVSIGDASILISVRAKVPLNDRPGQVHGKLGCSSVSRRSAEMLVAVLLATTRYSQCVGA